MPNEQIVLDFQRVIYTPNKDISRKCTRVAVKWSPPCLLLLSWFGLGVFLLYHAHGFLNCPSCFHTDAPIGAAGWRRSGEHKAGPAVWYASRNSANCWRSHALWGVGKGIEKAEAGYGLRFFVLWDGYPKAAIPADFSFWTLPASPVFILKGGAWCAPPLSLFVYIVFAFPKLNSCFSTRILWIRHRNKNVTEYSVAFLLRWETIWLIFLNKICAFNNIDCDNSGSNVI